MRIPFEQRFWSKVDKHAPGGCWLWTAGRSAAGYGTINPYKSQFSTWLAHRIAYEMRHGPLSSDAHCLHRCDTPACVNPDHIFLGDQIANIRDMLAKGRHNRHGKDHCKAGHRYSVVGFYAHSGSPGARICKACHKLRHDRWKSSKGAAA